MSTEFKLPELGEGVESADVSRIYISEGDQIEADENVMELETEKAVADLPCPHAGKVTEIHVSEGDTIHVGQTLLSIEEVQAKDKEEEPRQQPHEAKEETEKESEPTGEATADTDEEETSEKEDKATVEFEETDEKEERDKEQTEQEEKKDRGPSAKEERRAAAKDGKHRPPRAGPATRRLARKLGVDLDEFQPPEGGRIMQEDVVRAFVESGKAAALMAEPLPDFTQFGPVEREPLNTIARTSVKRLTAAWHTVPHVTQHGLADITDLEAARREHVEQAGDAAPKITLTAIAVKTITGLLKEFPKFNSSLDIENDELILKKHYHIGVAVDTDHGLLVPVIANADRKSIEQIATELADLADKARRRRLDKRQLEGGTFTISNQGGIGGGEFTPIVNYPEVAILGLARSRLELRMVDDQPAERLMLPLSLSYDHRAINGADAARFMDRLTEILSNEFALLIAT